MTSETTTGGPGLTRFARRGLARLAYEVVGDGPATVVLLHDLLADRATLRRMRDALVDAGIRVILPDARGHGASAAVPGLRITMAELVLDLLAILDAEAVATVRIAGAGLGAVIGLDLAVVEPDRVERLVLIDPSLPGMVRDEVDPGLRAAAEADRDLATKVADLANKGSLDRALDLYYAPRLGADWRTRLPKARVGAMRRHANAFGPLLTALLGYRPTVIASSNEPEVLILATDQATVLDRTAAERLHALLPASRLETGGDVVTAEQLAVRFLTTGATE